MHNLKFIVLLCLSAASSSASAWWNDDWPYRAPVTLDTTAVGAGVAESVVEFPVLIRLHSGNFIDFFLLKGDLSDLRFVAGDDKTPLKHHVEHFDLVNQMIFVWVKVPQLTGGIATERIWMYYGNENAVDGSDPGGSYDVSQAGVYHFAEPGGPSQDKSAYANHASNITATVNPGSLIGAGLQFAGGQTLELPDSPSLRLLPDKGLTISAWIRPAGAQQEAYLAWRGNGADSLIFGIAESQLYARLTLNGQTTETPRTAPLTPDVWQHVAVTVGSGKLSVYINGAEVAAAEAAPTELGGATLIGGGIQGNYYTGELDELAVSTAVRPGAWMQLSARNQGQQDTLLRITEAEQLGNAGHTSYFMVILRNMTFDGWVVVFLLFIMAIVSTVVMVAKTLYLKRVQDDNKAFLEQYYKLGASNPATLDQEESEDEKQLQDAPVSQALFGKHDHFQSSPIYHVYHKGMREVKLRLGGSVGAKASGLSVAATNAIRASMDAFMVREMQKLNAHMVLLTIAISGGPFLGLLGTVVGVMITFAAIAASGDVNITAIAPGMAAALLATVAGLAVAIPALFGYNYLGSKIKEVMADMRVFVDEFVTRIAEYYG